MKKVILTLLMMLSTSAAWCAKAYPWPVTITQRDGCRLTIIQHGDEHFNYVTTTDGVLLYQEGNDYFIARTESDGSLSPTRLLAHNAGQRTPQEIAEITLQRRDLFSYYADSERESIKFHHAPNREPINIEGTTLFPHTGTPNVLVILADFIDQQFKFDDEKTIDVFNTYLNYNFTGNGNKIEGNKYNNYGGVKRYFSDMSSKQFQPNFKIEAVVHLPDSMAHYGPGKNDRMDLFIPDVCKLADEAGVDFSQYDMNDDGKVDLVYVIYAGYGQQYTGNSSDCIWPKSGTTVGGTYDGKDVVRYGVHCELNFSPSKTQESYGGVPQINGIGLFCHEFSHCMGLPDFYPTKEYAQNQGNPALEYWDLMDGGEYTYFSGYIPTAYTAWEREAFGWITIDTLRDDQMGKRIELKNIDSSGGKAYRILKDDEENSNEYAILQNIQNYKWNQALAQQFGHGMLAFHVDYDANSFSLGLNDVNNTVGHSRMTLFAADGLVMSSYTRPNDSLYVDSHHSDPYPGSLEVTEIENFPVYSGTMNKSIYDIQENGSIISFYYLVTPIPQEDSYHVDSVAFQRWSLATMASTSILPESTSGTDDNGNDILFAQTFDEMSFSFDNLSVTPLQGFHVNLNPKEETSIDVTFQVKVVNQEEPMTITKTFALEKNTWNTLNLPIDSTLIETNNDDEEVIDDISEGGEGVETEGQGEGEEEGQGDESEGDGQGGESEGEGQGGEGEEEFVITQILSVTLTPTEPCGIFYDMPLFFGNDQGISTYIPSQKSIQACPTAYYDLNGQRINFPNNLRHGIYIRNGKKYIK